MQRVTKWFINLKKWQKGGLIGCAVGVVFATLMVLALDQYPSGPLMCEWVLRLHLLLYVILVFTIPYHSIWVYCAGAGVMIVAYGGYGAIVGRFQQVANPRIRWLLTGLSALFLLYIYWFNLQFDLTSF